MYRQQKRKNNPEVSNSKKPPPSWGWMEEAGFQEPKSCGPQAELDRLRTFQRELGCVGRGCPAGTKRLSCHRDLAGNRAREERALPPPPTLYLLPAPLIG